MSPQDLVDEPAVEDAPVDDDELCRAALAADPDAAIPDDAVSFFELADDGSAAPLLPAWYMPTTTAGVRRLTGWRRGVVFSLVSAFLAVDCVGLCTTYGPVVFGH